MIIYPLFIKSCVLVRNNAQLLFILVKLARGTDFTYNKICTSITNKELRVTKAKQVITFTYYDKPPDIIVEQIKKIYNIQYNTILEEKTVKEYLIRDFVVDNIKSNLVSNNESRKVFNYVLLCYVLKIFGNKNIEMIGGRISNITGIDTKKLTLNLIPTKPEQRSSKIKRMDSLWLN